MSENSNIFDTNNDYIIPLYQRGYEWKEKEIEQLIEDIKSIDINKNYYIGTLIVSKKELKNEYIYEIIDGQQRLTTLFLIFNFLKPNVKNSLKFACRDKANYTLKHIKEIIDTINNRSKRIEKKELENNLIEHNIETAIRTINDKLKELENIDDFKRKLSKVIIYQIEVPKYTDLNHYFEIMNTRGEQLSQSDILKARLMSYLKDSKKDQTVFSTIWEACSDMNTYVQMNFNKKVRTQLFGHNWNNLPDNNWDTYKDLEVKNLDDEKSVKIDNIINPNYKIENIDYQLDGGEIKKFESIIEFPFFLIHVLKIFVSENFQNQNIIFDELIDDKKLLQTFCSVIDMINEKDREDFVKKFIIYLIRCRFLFDKYIIKRKYLSEEDSGKWSLQELNVSKEKNFYINTIFLKKYEKKRINEKRNKNILMLQSLLRVTYTSPKVMYWITELLKWLIENDCNNIRNSNIYYFDEIIEKYIIKEVNENFFNIENAYSKGVDTHHIVFNYLDYLLWKNYNNKENKEDFVFEFRNTVEHWYPQHPSKGSFEEWKEKDELNHFGNLCLIQRDINSEFSNMSPVSKKNTFKERIEKGSLKLRLMSEETVEKNDMDADMYWKKEGYKIHGEKMIKLLKEACNKYES